jgi:mRNA-degrading endonuclease toxin of MazEF toxin-antitoxin module
MHGATCFWQRELPTFPKPGVVNISQILTVDKAELFEFVGDLSGTAASAVRDRVQMLFDRL